MKNKNGYHCTRLRVFKLLLFEITKKNLLVYIGLGPTVSRVKGTIIFGYSVQLGNMKIQCMKNCCR